MPIRSGFDGLREKLAFPLGLGTVIGGQVLMEDICFTDDMLFHVIVDAFEQMFDGLPEKDMAGDQKAGIGSAQRPFHPRYMIATARIEEFGQFGLIKSPRFPLATKAMRPILSRHMFVFFARRLNWSNVFPLSGERVGKCRG